MITEQQRLERKLGLGGSDAAAVLGLSTRKTPLDLFLEKTSVAEKSTIKPNAAFFGNELEPTIAKYYQLQMNVKVRRKNKTVVSKKYPWMRANLDYMVEGKRIVLECKTAHPSTYKNWGDEGTDQIPLDYFCQVLHYMIVVEASEAHVAVFFGANEMRIYVVKYSQAMAERLIEAERKFWHEHVLKNIPPPPSKPADCDLLFPMDDGSSIIASPEIESLAFQLLEKKRLVAQLEVELKALEFPLKEYMADAEFLTSASGRKLVQWDTTSPTRLDTASMKTAHPELCEKYMVSNTQRSFRPNTKLSELALNELESSVARNAPVLAAKAKEKKIPPPAPQEKPVDAAIALPLPVTVTVRHSHAFPSVMF